MRCHSGDAHHVGLSFIECNVCLLDNGLMPGLPFISQLNIARATQQDQRLDSDLRVYGAFGCIGTGVGKGLLAAAAVVETTVYMWCFRLNTSMSTQ